MSSRWTHGQEPRPDQGWCYAGLGVISPGERLRWPWTAVSRENWLKCRRRPGGIFKQQAHTGTDTEAGEGLLIGTAFLSSTSRK